MLQSVGENNKLYHELGLAQNLMNNIMLEELIFLRTTKHFVSFGACTRARKANTFHISCPLLGNCI